MQTYFLSSRIQLFRDCRSGSISAISLLFVVWLQAVMLLVVLWTFVYESVAVYRLIRHNTTPAGDEAVWHMLTLQWPWVTIVSKLSFDTDQITHTELEFLPQKPVSYAGQAKQAYQRPAGFCYHQCRHSPHSHIPILHWDSELFGSLFSSPAFSVVPGVWWPGGSGVTIYWNDCISVKSS